MWVAQRKNSRVVPPTAWGLAWWVAYSFFGICHQPLKTSRGGWHRVRILAWCFLRYSTPDLCCAVGGTARNSSAVLCHQPLKTSRGGWHRVILEQTQYHVAEGPERHSEKLLVSSPYRSHVQRTPWRLCFRWSDGCHSWRSQIHGCLNISVLWLCI